MPNKPMNSIKILSSGAHFFNEVGKYAYATAEYTGLVTFSLVKKGGSAVVRPFSKIAEPISKVNFKKLLPALKGEESERKRVKGLEEKIAILEERLTLLEQSGIAMLDNGASPDKQADIDRRKMALLREITEANIRLREVK